MAIRFDLVNENGALFTSVAGEIALTVAVQIQSADPTTALDRILPDPRMHRATPPRDVARQSHIYRQ